MNKFIIMVGFLAGALTLYAERVSVTYKVTDEGGMPIAGARIETSVETGESLSRWYGSAEYDNYMKITDSRGVAVCNFRTQDGGFWVSINAEGFYKEEISTNRFVATYDMKAKKYVFSEKEKKTLLCSSANSKSCKNEYFT